MSPLLAGLRLLAVLRKNRFPNLETDASTPGQPTPDLGSRFSQLEVGDGPPDVAPPPPDNWVARPAHVDDRPDGSSLGMDSSAPPPEVLDGATRLAANKGKPHYVGFDPDDERWIFGSKPDRHTTHEVQPNGTLAPYKYVNPHIARHDDGSVMKFGDGGRPIFHMTEQGQALCHECADSEDPDDPVVSHGPNWQNPTMRCMRCFARIASVYT